MSFLGNPFSLQTKSDSAQSSCVKLGVLQSYQRRAPNLVDGGLSLAATGARPSILVFGPASQGLSNVPQLCVTSDDVKRLYGANTAMEDKVAEIIGQAGTETYFIYCMRVGGVSPVVTLKDDQASNNGELKIIPTSLKDREAFERLALVLAPIDPDGDGTYEQRFMLYDLEQQQIVYDSHDMLATGTCQKNE